MFEINKTLLQLFKYKKQYNKLRGLVKLNLLDKEIVDIIKEIDKYWKCTQDDVMNIGVFSSQLFTSQNNDDVKNSIYEDVLLTMQEDPDYEVSKSLVKGLRELEFAKKIDDLQTSYAVGDDIDFYEEIYTLTKDFEKDIRKSVDSMYCDASIEDIINDETSGVSLEWKLQCLKGSIPNLRTGQQIILAARPGKGKTSFCADTVTYFAQQKAVRDSGRPILWMNNESKAVRIKGTCIRAALNMTFDEIIQQGWEETTRQYNERVGKDTIRIFDIHGRDYKFLERLIDEHKPIVVVWDMLGNVQGFSKDRREDQRLEKLYQCAREASVIYDFLSIPTCQVSDGGSDMMFIPDSCLKDSRTAVQGACDAIITMGSIDKPGFEKSRFINIPKTKFAPLQGYSEACKTEVVFDGTKANFYNPK